MAYAMLFVVRARILVRARTLEGTRGRRGVDGWQSAKNSNPVAVLLQNLNIRIRSHGQR